MSAALPLEIEEVEPVLDPEEEALWQREMADARRIQQTLLLSKICMLLVPGLGHALLSYYLARHLLPRVAYSPTLRRKTMWVLAFNLAFVAMAVAVVGLISLKQRVL